MGKSRFYFIDVRFGGCNVQPVAELEKKVGVGHLN